MTTNHFPAWAGGHAIESSHCAGLKLEEITLYASPCFGFVEHACDGFGLPAMQDRSPPASRRPRAAGFPRMRSLVADAFHSNEAVRGPAIIGCTAKFQGDDCVNIHGTLSFHHVLRRVTELRVAATRPMTIEPGDPVEFLPFHGPRPPDATARKIEPDAPLDDAEKAFFKKVDLAPRHERRADWLAVPAATR